MTRFDAREAIEMDDRLVAPGGQIDDRLVSERETIHERILSINAQHVEKAKRNVELLRRFALDNGLPVVE